MRCLSPLPKLICPTPMPNALTDLARSAIADYWQAVADDPTQLGMHLSGSGAVATLEAKLCEWSGKSYALCVANATIGLWAIARALDLEGAEFVTTPYTYGASLAGWLLLQNRPIFAGVDSNTLTLDPMAVRQAITPQTRAILAVDILGNPCDSAALRAIAAAYGLWYIADGAQSLGARRGGRPASVEADAIVVSFTVGKTVCAGEGGAILTDNADLYERLVWWTQHPDRQRRDLGLGLVNELGLNARIHPLAAVVANATFGAALQRLQGYQDWCFQVIAALNASGLTQPIRFRELGMVPSFFRLAAAWQEEPQEARLIAYLVERGLAVRLEPLPFSRIDRQPAFIAQYGQGVDDGVSLSEPDLTRSGFCLIST